MRTPTQRSLVSRSSGRRSASQRGCITLALAGLALAPISARADGKPLVTVVIDPGHGGSNLGAPGSGEGVYEKKLTLAVARLVRKRLERDGINVVATRDADV